MRIHVPTAVGFEAPDGDNEPLAAGSSGCFRQLDSEVHGLHFDTFSDVSVSQRLRLQHGSRALHACSNQVLAASSLPCKEHDHCNC